jgi:TolB-like protein
MTDTIITDMRRSAFVVIALAAEAAMEDPSQQQSALSVIEGQVRVLREIMPEESESPL